MSSSRWAALALVLGASLLPLRGGAEPTESKQALIRELLAISGFAGISEQMAEQQSIVELMRIKPNYGPLIELAVAEEPGLSDAERRLLRERLEPFDRFAERFRGLFVERLDFEAIIDSVYLPLYDRYFAEGELREMLDFYRTAVGRKAIEVMPALMHEAGRGVDLLVRPQAAALIQQIVSEERAGLKP